MDEISKKQRGKKVKTQKVLSAFIIICLILIPPNKKSIYADTNQLVFSTFLGGNEFDQALCIKTDQNNNIIVAGYTDSKDFPIKNAEQSKCKGDGDAFISKFDSKGQLVFSTFLGGTKKEYARSIFVDKNGFIFLCGDTESADFPTKNAFQSKLSGGSDAFITKLDPAGQIVYSTFLGGDASEFGASISNDNNFNVIIVGATFSNDFPIKNAYQEKNMGSADVFITMLDPTGQLLSSTYLGGKDYDIANCASSDMEGNIITAGHSRSSDLPIKNSVQEEESEGVIFVIKMSSDNQLIYSTFLGGGEFDEATGVAIDLKGNAYFSGKISVNNLPIKNAFQEGKQGNNDAFITKLDPLGELVYSTYLGGSGYESSDSITVDKDGCVYLAGSTTSTDFPVKNAYQPELNKHKNKFSIMDVFVAKLDPTGQLAYGSYLGGNDVDCGYSISVDLSGGVVVCGRTNSIDFPVDQAYQKEKNQKEDGFIVKLNLDSNLNPKPNPLESNASFSFTIDKPEATEQDTFTLSVNVDQLDKAASIDMTLSYPDALLQVESCGLGDLLKSQSFDSPSMLKKPGTIQIKSSSRDHQESTGSGVLFELKLKAKKSGLVLLDFGEITLLNKKGEKVSYAGKTALSVVIKPRIPSPPPLTIKPVPKVVYDSDLQIEGLTNPGINVMINRKEVTVNEDGSFQTKINLTIGVNTIKVEASNQFGDKSTETIVVTRKERITISLTIGSKTMVVNAHQLVLDAEPFIDKSSGRTMIPLRAIAEAIGSAVSFYAKEQRIEIQKDSVLIQLWIGKPNAIVNGKDVPIDQGGKVSPVIVKGRTFVPLRFVAETFEFKVDWDAKTQGITLTYPK
jgi:hypothetical protein